MLNGMSDGQFAEVHLSSLHLLTLVSAMGYARRSLLEVDLKGSSRLNMAATERFCLMEVLSHIDSMALCG